MKKIHAIYRIYNLKSKKSYVGSAVNVTQRLNAHLTKLIAKEHSNVHLQRAWTKYGSNEFALIVIEIVEDPLDLIPREQYWIDKFDAFKKGYNRRPIAQSNLGFKHSEKTKEKMSKSQMGNKVVITEEQKKKISQALMGRKPSDETKAKLSAAQKGRTITWGDKISEAGKKSWANPEHRAKRLANNRSLSKEIIFNILDDHKSGDSKRSLAEKYGITRRMISYIVNGQNYSDYYQEWGNK